VGGAAWRGPRTRRPTIPPGPVSSGEQRRPRTGHGSGGREWAGSRAWTNLASIISNPRTTTARAGLTPPRLASWSPAWPPAARSNSQVEKGRPPVRDPLARRGSAVTSACDGVGGTHPRDRLHTLPTRKDPRRQVPTGDDKQVAAGDVAGQRLQHVSTGNVENTRSGNR